MRFDELHARSREVAILAGAQQNLHQWYYSMDVQVVHVQDVLTDILRVRSWYAEFTLDVN